MKRVAIIVGQSADQSEIKRYLAAHGFYVHQARDARAGINLCRDKQPEIIFADCDGCENPAVLKAMVSDLRTALADTPIVILSPHPGPMRRKVANDAGASFCLAKPVDAESIAEMADVACRSNHLHAMTY